MSKDKFWDLLDGELSAEEQAALEQQIQADEAALSAQAERQLLHQELHKIEAEQPSMRFAKNIMERLPNLYRRLTIQPLVSPATLRIIIGSFSLFVLGYVMIAILVVRNLPKSESAVHPIASTFYSVFSSTSSNTISMLFGLSFGFILLLALDQWLKKVFKTNRLDSSKS